MGAPLTFKLTEQEALLKYLKVQQEVLPKKMLDDPSDDVPERSWEELLEAHWKEDSLTSIKTVRFMKDFERYQARPDLKTTNKSFIRTMEVFRRMGIKNCAFHLQLNNPLLVGVNPRDPNLTDDQRLMIMQEMQDNFWYFLREVCHLNGGIRFRANRANISFAWCWLNHLTTMLILPRQQGKAYQRDQQVKTKSGWTPIGELKVGDLVLAPDGKYVKVKGVYPQGERDLYRITFIDNRYVDCDGSHLWKFYDPGKGAHGIWRVEDTNALKDRLEETLNGKGKIRLSIPLVNGESGNGKNLSINPWVLGVLLGDGCISNGQVEIAKPDQFVFDKVKSLLDPKKFSISWVSDKRFKISRLNTQTHEIAEHLKKYDLFGCRAWEKFIPLEYMEGNRQQRLELLQGLLDTDGYAGKDGTVEFCTTSPTLSDQVQLLVRSLGGIATVTTKIPTYTLKGEKREGRLVYRMKIRYREPAELFTLPRKRERLVGKDRGKTFNSKLSIKSIEPVGKGEAVCIEVDHPDHLFVTKDYIVTHNTVTAQCIFFWLTYISGRAYESHLITLKDDNRQQFVDAIKGIRNNIPAWMTNVTYRDKDAGNSLTYSAFGDEVKNKLTISVPQIGQEAARNVGRGLTIKSRFIDEPAYIKWMEEILNGAGPSTLTARENARRLNEPYATGFITTPASILTESGAYMYNILMESTEWRENYFDCYGETHLYDVLLKNSPKVTTAPSVGMVFNYLQLGKDRDWVKRTIDELKLSLSEAKIDLLLMWDDNGKGKLFDDETRDALNEAKRGRKWSQQITDTSLYFDWFITPEEHAEIMSGKNSTYYLIGLDTSGAVGRDACTIVVRDIRDGSVAGVGRYQRAFLTEVGMVVQTLLMELPNSLLIPERNYAHHMIDQLIQSLPAVGLDPFKKIYNRIFQDPVKYQAQYREIKARGFGNRNDAFYLKYKEFFGFNTGAKSRETLYGFLEEAVGLTGAVAHYTKLIDELTNLKLKNGRIDHEDGAHDDIVISWLLTYWFIKLGENKNEYGIPPGISLSNVTTLKLGGVNKELSDPVQEKRVRFYKQKIEEVSNMLMETDDPIIAARLETALDRLHQMIPNEMRKSITIDDIKRRAVEERNKRNLELKRNKFRGY